MNKPRVSIVMGSSSDLPVMDEASRILDDFKIPHEVTISSAHRSPARTVKFALEIEKSDIEVIIAGAGGSAHLAGLLAGLTTVPVIGVPLEGSPLNGIDALYSTVQMPTGVPVATMAVGKAGVKNAAIFAIEILALKDSKLKSSLKKYKKKLARSVEEKAKKLLKEKRSKT